MGRVCKLFLDIKYLQFPVDNHEDILDLVACYITLLKWQLAPEPG